MADGHVQPCRRSSGQLIVVVDRSIRHARTGPRATKVTFVVDVGLVIEPKGVEAQMMGGINDALAI